MDPVVVGVEGFHTGAREIAILHIAAHFSLERLQTVLEHLVLLQAVFAPGPLKI